MACEPRSIKPTFQQPAEKAAATEEDNSLPNVYLQTLLPATLPASLRSHFGNSPNSPSSTTTPRLCLDSRKILQSASLPEHRPRRCPGFAAPSSVAGPGPALPCTAAIGTRTRDPMDPRRTPYIRPRHRQQHQQLRRRWQGRGPRRRCGRVRHGPCPARSPQ